MFRIDLDGATEVSGVFGEAELAGKAVPKTLFLNVVAELEAHGFANTDIPAKLEGMTFGPDVRSGRTRQHTLFISSDNDFLASITDSTHPAGLANANRFFVFAWGEDAEGAPAVRERSVLDDADD